MLRFENHSCEWSLFDLPYVERSKVRTEDAAGFDDEVPQETYRTGMSSDDYMYTNRNEAY